MLIIIGALLTGGMDYDNTTLVATFDVGDLRSAVCVPVYLDDNIEGEEDFMIRLDVPPLHGSRVSAGIQATAVGAINDPDGKYQ